MPPSAPITLHYLQHCVRDINRTVDDLRTWGFAPEQVRLSGLYPRCVALRQGSITLIAAEAGSATSFYRRHGDGVSDVALATTDITEVYRRAVSAGAEVVRDLAGGPVAASAVIASPAGIVHTITEHHPGHPLVHLPALGTLSATPAPTPMGLHRVDHLAIVCRRDGDLERTEAFYQDAFGFDTIFNEEITTGASRMRSVVVSSGSGVVLTLVAPAGATGQLDFFLDRHRGPGVQHVAYETDDIVTTVNGLRQAGLSFAGTPDAYYNRLPQRLGRLRRHDVEALRSLGVLADRDHAGELYQVFGESQHPRATYFTEVIERDGATTFGKGNIRALFEALDSSLSSKVTR
jgi:4-hydroxymandelate synthase